MEDPHKENSTSMCVCVALEGRGVLTLCSQIMHGKQFINKDINSLYYTLSILCILSNNCQVTYLLTASANTKLN